MFPNIICYQSKPNATCMYQKMLQFSIFYSYVFRMVLQLTLMRTTSAASKATSVPEPIAIPMSAWAKAGESLTPSPTIAT